MRQLFLILLFIASATVCWAQKSEKIVVISAHSHNDYEHKRPLFEALEWNFKSVEADVYSVGDSLFVAHNFDQIKPGRTLRRLYLEPLRQRINQNNGSAYGNGEEILLLVDIKDDPMRTYLLLHKILSEYQHMLTSFENGKKKPGSVTVIISGNRPFEFMQSQDIRFAGYDGRLLNLDSDISPGLMPMVSDNWSHFFSWNGIGKMNREENQKLRLLAEKARNKGYILRFWGTPNDTPDKRVAVWSELKKAGVGLIGDDNLKELHDFFVENKGKK